MRFMIGGRTPLVALGTGVLISMLAGCTSAGDAGDPAPSATAPAAPTPSAAPAAPVNCDNALVSYAPVGALPAPGKMPAGSTMAAIQKRGRLIVGVSGDTRQFGASNPLKEGAPIEGFDIDVVKRISTAIFGNPNQVTYKVITAANRIPALKNNDVDIVARNMTINCQRWTEIAFSAEYFRAGQKVLVAKGSSARGIEDLKGKRVCAPQGSTSLENLKKYPGVVGVGAARHTDCVVKFQQGTVDAITGDDAILAGFVDQDPFLEPVGKAFSVEPYGLGVKKENKDLVRFVNGVLEQMKADGSWTKAYNEWLAVPLKVPAPAPPKPQYGRR